MYVVLILLHFMAVHRYIFPVQKFNHRAIMIMFVSTEIMWVK